MAYIPSHQELRDHPKVKRLARLLDVGLPAAIGHLHGLWWWAMDYAPDGDVSRFDEFDLADAGMWDGAPTVFVKALQQCGPGGTHGFLDDTHLHDWDEYGGKVIAKREADRERKARSRQQDPPPPADPPLYPSEGRPSDQSNGSPRDVRVTAQVEKSREEETREEQENPLSPDGDDGPALELIARDPDEDIEARFQEFWAAFPKHNLTGRIAGGGNKKPALKNWRKLNRQQRDACLVAVYHYRAECDSLPKRTVKQPEGWLSEERWITYAEPSIIRARGQPAHASTDAANEADRFDRSKWN